MRSDEVGSIAIERRLAGSVALPLRGTVAAPLPGHVREAVVAALGEHDVTPPSRGHAPLREAIGRGVGADPEREVLVTNGAMHALSLLFRALLESADEVLVPTPAYFFGGLIERAGGRPVEVPSHEDDGWRLDVDALAAAVTPRTRALVLCNPVNPTGHVPPADDVEALVGLADRHGLTLVTDEAYEGCIYEGELATAFGRPGVVLVRSLGKSLAMPSWRLGFLAGEAGLVDRCLRLLEWDVLRVGHVVQRAATAALEGPTDWLDGLLAGYRRDRDAAHALVAASTVLSARLPDSTPFLFVNLGALRSAEPLLAAGIPVVPGEAFGAPGFARLAFAGAAALQDELREALARATALA